MAMTQIPLLAFCFTQCRELFISSDVQENAVSIFRRNNSALHLRICQPLFLLLLQILYHIAFYLGFKKTFIDEARIGNFLTKRIDRELQKNQNFKGSLGAGGIYCRMS